MGLLDWLSEGIGSNMGGVSPSSSPPPMPQMQDPGSSGAMSPGAMPPPAMTPPPMSPTTGDGSDGAALPPGATPTVGTGLSLPPNMAPPTAPPSGFRQNGVGPLGRAMGLDANRASELGGSLASGLKSVGDNWNKPGLAAFSGSAGSALEGGNKAGEKTVEQQQKYLTQAILAAKAGDERALNTARTKLALAQAKTAEEGDPEKTALTVARTRESTARARKLEAGGEDPLKAAQTRLADARTKRLESGSDKKDSPINSPEQLYLRAVGATNSDGKLSLLKNAYIQASKDGQQDTPAAKAAKEAYEKAYDETRDGHLKTLGVDPKIASKIGKQAGFSADNPIPSAGLTKEKFDQLPVGSYFLNPKDGRLLIKQPPAGANPAPVAPSPTPVAPPVPVTAPAGSAADSEDD